MLLKQKTICRFLGEPHIRGVMVLVMFLGAFFRWVVPILKENAMPVIKNLGKETLKGAINVATDALDGQDIKSSAKSNLKKSLQNISTQYGNGKKRKKRVFKETKTFKKPNHSTNKKKRRLDIFD